MEGLDRLQVYCKAQELAKLIYQLVLPKMPHEEKYNLSSQMRRAAVSIPANIAEGYGRYYYQETIRFCYLARGSLMELSSHLQLAFDQGFLPNEMKSIFDENLTDVHKLIQGYVNYLKRSKRGSYEPRAQSISENLLEYSLNLEDEDF